MLWTLKRASDDRAMTASIFEIFGGRELRIYYDYNRDRVWRSVFSRYGDRSLEVSAEEARALLLQAGWMDVPRWG
jgi:hypothetical protein